MNSKEKLILFSALALVVLLRLPSLADPKYYLDEGVYSSVAYEIGQGGTLYQTAWDLKPPGIFYVYLFFQKLFGTHAFLAQRIFNTILAALAVFGVYKLAKILKAPQSGAATATLLTAIFLGLPFFETQIFNTENIFITTSLFAFIFGLRFKNSELRSTGWREPFLAGLLFGAGQWLKIHPLFDLAAFGIFALYKFRLNKNFWLPFAIGFATPLLALLVYLVTNGILADFIETNVSYNLFYVEELPQIKIFGNLLTRTLLLVAATTALVCLKFKNKISENTLLLSLWFTFVFYGALLSARAYGHYFIPVLLPIVLLVARFARPGLAKAIAAVFLPFVVFFLLQKPAGVEILNFYQTRLSYIVGKTDQRQFEQNFTPKPWRLRELKKHLDENVSAGEQVYLWGNSPWASYVLQRRPVHRYLMWFHILGIKEREEDVFEDILTKMPETILVEDSWPEGETSEISRPPFPKLQNFIDTNYKFETTVAGYDIYRLRSLALILRS